MSSNQIHVVDPSDTFVSFFEVDWQSPSYAATSHFDQVPNCAFPVKSVLFLDEITKRLFEALLSVPST